MTTPDKCLKCPRETMYESATELLEGIRTFQTAAGENMLDDEKASAFAGLINSLGLSADEQLDGQAVRDLLLSNFELLDKFESILNAKREQETQFCVGALRLRAKDLRTEYTVSICRSPQSDSGYPGDIQLANVQTRTI